jgi:tetratricopeptide (TPR) repeat protein
VSPVPLAATFTTSDVAVANAYSKAVLRAAAEALVVERPHVEFFPSYESVTLTDRSLAFADDQMHVNRAIVNFNVDRMISRYVRASGGEATSAEIIEQARKEGRTGHFGAALKRLQGAWAKQPDDAELVLALAQAQLNVGAGPNAEKLLIDHLARHSDAAAHLMLAEYYNACGRHAEAALHAEKVAGLGKLRLRAAMQRIIAYYHLQRYDEGIAVLNGLRQAHAAGVSMVYWKARYLEKLNRPAEAEEFFRRCNTISEQAPFMLGFAEFLAGQKRWAEAVEWVDHALLTAPNNKAALKLRNEIAIHFGPGQKLPPAPVPERSAMKILRRLVRSW